MWQVSDFAILPAMTPQKFRNVVWKYWEEYGRHDLPWRKTTDPYKILVSEVMLQQTQVERVIPYYKVSLKRFPTVRSLAEAPLSDVLTLWQGLGYNRRAKMLHQAAKVVVEEYGGKFPKTAQELEKLPGIGPYTAGAVAAFSYNQDGVFIETNIRTAITHHFFANTSESKNGNHTIYGMVSNSISDQEICEVLEKVSPKGQARDWYAALMDYGAHLKRSGVRINARAKGYTKQSAFAGSSRQVRGAILRLLTSGPATRAQMYKLFDAARKSQVVEQLEKLQVEGMIIRKQTEYRLAD